MDPTKLINPDELSNPAVFDVRHRSINFEELGVNINEIELRPSEGNLYVYWEEDEDFWVKYRQKLNNLKEEIEGELEKEEEGVLDGKKWCKENDTREKFFAEAIEDMEYVRYGISPMYPFYRGE